MTQVKVENNFITFLLQTKIHKKSSFFHDVGTAILALLNIQFSKSSEFISQHGMMQNKAANIFFYFLILKTLFL
jgi:hypothetical protein